MTALLVQAVNIIKSTLTGHAIWFWSQCWGFLVRCLQKEISMPILKQEFGCQMSVQTLFHKPL